MKHLAYLLACVIGLAISTPITAKSNLVTFEDESGSVNLTLFEHRAFELAYQDIETQRFQESGHETYEDRMRFEGKISIDGSLFNYISELGEIAIYDGSWRLVSSIPAGRILEIVASSGADSDNAARCPWCLAVAVGIIVHQAACSGAEAAGHAYCQATCRCGVRDVNATCIAGMRNTSCGCYECPDPPDPPSTFPIFGSWAGPLVPGTPWIDFGDGPFVIPGNFSTP